MSKTKKITVSAIMVALSIVLTLVSKVIPAPWLQGGSITIASAVPIILVSLILGWKWGLISSVAFSIIQMMTGFYSPPTQTFIYFVLVILFDYVLAFGVYGLAGIFYPLFKKRPWAIPLSGCIVMVLRFVCHIISGVLIWGVYAEEGQSVWQYSLLYNGTYMVPEIIITTIVLALLIPFVRSMEKQYGR